MGGERDGSNCVSDPMPSWPFEFPPQQNTAEAVELQVCVAPAAKLVNVRPPTTIFGIRIMVLKASFDPIWPNPLLKKRSKDGL